MSENNAYILGTAPDELFRLGVQHQVWASEAQRGWENAGFTAGNTLVRFRMRTWILYQRDGTYCRENG